jgi:Antitoxin MazE-like
MSNVSERVNRHRRKLRQAGLRPIQIWVPDTRTPEFQEECHRQSRMLSEDPQEQETLDWLKEAGDRTDWE